MRNDVNIRGGQVIPNRDKSYKQCSRLPLFLVMLEDYVTLEVLITLNL